jgi:transposase
MSENEWTKILGWPGYRVYRSEINEVAKTLRLWVRRKRGNRKLECSGCGRRVNEIVETYEREVRDLPWSEYRATVVIELYRVRCPDCGIKAEKVALLPSKAPSASALRKRWDKPVRALRCNRLIATVVTLSRNSACNTQKQKPSRQECRLLCGRSSERQMPCDT